MTHAGARNATEAEMASTLHFTLSQSRLHTAFNALDLLLGSRGGDLPEDEGDPFQLHIANSIWGQKDVPFLPSFLDLLAESYGAGMGILDFHICRGRTGRDGVGDSPRSAAGRIAPLRESGS
jgi:serpin B